MIKNISNSKIENAVGPVLNNEAKSLILIKALLISNVDIQVVDQGSYFRILAKKRCVLKREVVEQLTNESFNLPQDLEPLMPSFKGNFQVDEDQAIWLDDEETT